MRTYQQLTYEQRRQISALKKSGCSQRKISETIETIETTQPTVSRELARDKGAREYRHKQAQERTEQRRAELCGLLTKEILILLKENRSSKVDISTRLGKHRSHLSKTLNGSRNLTLGTIADICCVLGVRPADLLRRYVRASDKRHQMDDSRASQSPSIEAFVPEPFSLSE